MPRQDKTAETVTPEVPEQVVEATEEAQPSPEVPAVEKVESPIDFGSVPESDGKLPVGLWVTETPTISVKVYAYKNLRDGKLFFFSSTRLVEPRKKELEENGVFLEEFEIPAEFTIPDRKQIDRYRERSSSLHEASGQMMINKSGMRRSVIRYHLTKLGLPNPETGEPLQIDRDSGKITRKVEDLLENLHPNLVDMLMLQFEVESGISL